jgi:hypothetical protein
VSAAATGLGALIDKQAMTAVLYRYARACDRADEAMMRDCFHPNATLRYGGFNGTAGEFCALALKIILGTVIEKHQVSNALIELSGDTAIAESHFMAYHRRVDQQAGAAEDMFSGGRFIDRFERRHGEWRIAARTGLVDYERFDAATERGFAQLAPEQKSQRLRADPLYALMPSLRVTA